MASLTRANAAPQFDTKLIQDSGVTEHPGREDDITLIEYKAKVARTAMCLPPVPARVQNSEKKRIDAGFDQ